MTRRAVLGHSGLVSEITDTGVVRAEVQVDGETASDLTVEQDGPAVLLLHGTYWSRVWLPVLGRLAKTGLGPIAVDLPGLGHSASCEIAEDRPRRARGAQQRYERGQAPAPTATGRAALLIDVVSTWSCALLQGQRAVVVRRCTRCRG